ncbi:ArsR/SmtB family transcription factor [Nocardia stercoris]|uniref:ArsR family transcriptional regulator n=1 Tax=Nocardia stercoris TaxID=2483361 RepID=A0A3M2LAQ8_9NOCA|nr:metalloregulator ArsR/SmtB family transcription factor [Nocardia stercoris]RMI33653.1 ArsR family transcriptional regulator [Nocardia stercoris]
MDDVFRALADPTRRDLLDRLNARNGQTLRELCAGADMARQSVSKHLAILEHAGLITAVRRGRERLHYLNPAPINEIAERWIDRYDRARVEALADLKQALEGTPVDTRGRDDFVYTTYIRTTPQQLWRALTEPAFTRRYWAGYTFESDWRPGSAITVTTGDGRIADDPEQVVLESDPFRLLAYTWHHTTTCDGGTTEPRSKVAFHIEDLGDLVKLTVIHDGFPPGSKVLDSISRGWPRVLADLKTLLETGDLIATTGT